MAKDKANNENKSSDAKSEELLNELRVVKQLVVILLAKLGSDSGEIGKALGIEPRRIREWVSFNGIERVTERPGKGKKRTPANSENKVESLDEVETTEEMVE